MSLVFYKTCGNGSLKEVIHVSSNQTPTIKELKVQIPPDSFRFSPTLQAFFNLFKFEYFVEN